MKLIVVKDNKYYIKNVLPTDIHFSILKLYAKNAIELLETYLQMWRFQELDNDEYPIDQPHIVYEIDHKTILNIGIINPSVVASLDHLDKNYFHVQSTILNENKI